MKIEIKDLPLGEYAISFFHDANENDAHDRNMVGIPKESYGLTNVEKKLSLPPKFKNCSFKFHENGQNVDIKFINVN